MNISTEIYNKLFSLSSDKSYSGRITVYKNDFLEVVNEALIEQDKKIANLEAKIFAYEAILQNSNFAMAVVKKPLDEPPMDPDKCPFGDKTNCGYYPYGCGNCPTQKG